MMAIEDTPLTASSTLRPLYRRWTAGEAAGTLFVK